MIKINGVIWRILLVPPYHPGLKRSDRIFSLGCCDYITKTIYLSKDIQDRYIKKVLCHELVHAFMFSYKIDLSLEEEEKVADLISTYGQSIVDTSNKISQNIKKQKRNV